MALSPSFDALRTYLGSWAWGPFVNLSRNAVLGILQRINEGQLIVTDIDGSITVCGVDLEGKDAPKTSIKILKEAFWVRVLLFADMVR